MVVVQGFGRPVSLEGTPYGWKILSGISAWSFAPDTADMSLNPTNWQNGNI